jgi:DNA mismatch repair ATPase MutS
LLKIHGKLNLKSLQVNYFPQFSWCFRVSRKDEKDLRQVRSVKYQTVDTKKDGVKFRTPELKTLGDRYDGLHQSYLSRQGELAKEVINVAGM